VVVSWNRIFFLIILYVKLFGEWVLIEFQLEKICRTGIYKYPVLNVYYVMVKVNLANIFFSDI